jgi:two-component system chemotaxis sensor kinase CheA
MIFDEVSSDSSQQDELSNEAFGTYVSELSETCSILEQKLVELESSPSNVDLMNQIFRSCHNLKGSSGMMGFTTIQELMHFGESVLDLARKGTMAVTAEMISLLLEMLTALKELCEHIRNNKKENGKRYFKILAALEDMHNIAKSGSSSESKDQKQKEEDRSEKKVKTDEEFIKVSRSLVDNMMLIVGDFMMVESSFQWMRKNYPSDWSFQENCQQLAHFSNKLQRTVLKMRLSPIQPIFNSLPRVVRATATETKKKVNLEVSGAETLVDRTILDVISDPLVHMLRNAVDHGIESPEQRALVGKPPEGQVTLAAFHRGSEIILQITDDGKGVDPERVKAKALSMGLITKDQASAMTTNEAQRLIFMPGLSGAEVVTSISGRGVGMDVVKQVVESVGGTIDLLSNMGMGTSVSLKLPLSLAISECLEFKVGDRSYAVAQGNVDEVFSMSSPLVKDGMRDINGDSKILVLRDIPIPVLDMSHVLEMKGDEKDPLNRHIILVRVGHVRFALEVGAIVGPCNIVSQPLPPIFAGDAPFSGLTKRGDGSLMFQLDLSRLLAHVHHQGEKRDASGSKIRGGQALNSSDLRRLQQKIAVFTTYENFCVPVHAIKRIISAAKNEIHDVDGKCYMTLDGQTIPLVWTEEIIFSRDRIQADQYSILIYAINENHLFGLPMSHFQGIIRMPMTYDNSMKSDIVTGSTVIDDKTYLVIDLYGLTSKKYQIPMQAKQVGKKVKKILIAEDDPFFREQILGFLKSQNLETVVAKDGMEAKEILENKEIVATLDAIVSDVEMPRLDGIGLTRWLKSNEATKHLPVIILTALTNKEVFKLSTQAGAMAFVPKMHHSQVLNALEKIEYGNENAVTDHVSQHQQTNKSGTNRLVSFNVGAEKLALSMDVLKEVSHQNPSVPVPNRPSWMNSVTSFRGKMIPVIDLADLFGLSKHAASVGEQKQAIIECDGINYCIRVDSVGDVFLLSQMKQGEGIPQIGPRASKNAKFLTGVYQNKGLVYSVIDSKALAALCTQGLSQLEEKAA